MVMPLQPEEGRDRLSFSIVNDSQQTVSVGLFAVMLTSTEGTETLRPVYSLRVAPPEPTDIEPSAAPFGVSIDIPSLAFGVAPRQASGELTAVVPHISGTTWYLATEVLFEDKRREWVTTPPITPR